MTNHNAFCGGSSSDFWEHYLNTLRLNDETVPKELPVRLGARILPPIVDTPPTTSFSDFIPAAEPFEPRRKPQA